MRVANVLFMYMIGFFVFMQITHVNAQSKSNMVFLYPNNNYDIGFGVIDTCNQHISCVVNGPLFKKDRSLVGGYVMTVKGKTVQVQDWVDPEDFDGNFREDNGIFGLLRSGEMIVQRYDDWIENQQDLQWGFQNGMILLLHGENLHSPSTSSRYIRSGIGYRDDGALVVAISKSPVNFYELGKALKEKGCNNAIYLDGSTSAVGYATPQKKVGFDKTALKLQFYH